jgi:hypothetical protein
MPLTMRPTGGHAPVYADRQDWTIFDDGKPVGRIYENAGASRPADLGWVGDRVRRSMAGITTSGNVPTLERAKAEFQRNWMRAAGARG